MEKNQIEGIDLQNVFGFYHELFVLENYVNYNFQKKYDEVIQKLDERRPVILLGDEGIGKTHFVHQLVRESLKRKRLKNAIYIDCVAGNLDKEIVREIMSSVLRKEQDIVIDLFEHDLKSEQIIIVFDNIYELDPIDFSYVFISSEKKGEFEEFILQLCSSGVGVVFICQSEPLQPIEGNVKIELEPLSEAAATDMLTRIIVGAGQIEFSRIVGLTGNPKVLKLLSRQFLNGNRTILDDYAVLLKKGETYLNKDVEAYYELIWKNLTDDEYKLAAVYSGLSNFIFDSFPIAIDLLEKESGEPCFSELPLHKGEHFRHFLVKLDSLGFLNRKVFGFEMSHHVYSFLNKNKAELVAQQRITAQVKAFELKILSSFITHNSEPLLYQKIMQNQRRWINTLECLWMENEVSSFIMAKKYFKLILLQGNLPTVYFQLMDELILKFQNSFYNDNGIKEITWLQLLIENLTYSKVKMTEYMVSLAGSLKDRLRLSEANEEVLPYQIMFLETFYSLTNDWVNRKFVSENVLEYYQKKNNLEYTIKAMSSLAKCEEQLGNSDRCLAIEESLVYDLNYEANPNLKKDVYLSVAMNRINRKAFSESLALLEWVEKNKEDSVKVDVALQWVKAEWHLAKNQYELALQKYAYLWNGILKGRHRFREQNIYERIQKLKQELKEDLFDEILRAIDNAVLESITDRSGSLKK